ncbi:MAG: hypothetical protein H6581_20660 [Bacteroidia bacterium]|nr:hypothetical protein [Bacteroidia bacterium]
MNPMIKTSFRIILLSLFMEMGRFVRGIFQDKEGNYSLREVSTFLFTALAGCSFFFEAIFSIEINPVYFLAFAGLAAIGKLAYSLERSRNPKWELPPAPSRFDELDFLSSEFESSDLESRPVAVWEESPESHAASEHSEEDFPEY